MADEVTLRPSRYLLCVDRRAHRLDVWYRGPLRKAYRLAESRLVAVGTEGHETPAGVYFVIDKKARPDYHVPDSEWAIKLGWTPGDVFPSDDERNPLAGAFLQVTEDPTGNIGIHGTHRPETLGTDASHGCIRVHEDVALSLHRRVPRGTPVVIL